MSAGRKKIMDALEGLSGDEDDSSSAGGSGSDAGSDEEGGGSGKKQKGADGSAVPAKKKQELTLDDLEAAGFTTGPSVLFIKPPAEEQQNWNWSDGKASKAEEAEDTLEERRRTHEAATTGAEEGAGIAMRGVAHSAALRQAALEERQRLAAEKKLSWNQKEKRKRDAGQASRGKSYVEEEKRLQRQMGMYTGFD